MILPPLFSVYFIVLRAQKRDKSMLDKLTFLFSFNEPKKGIKVYSMKFICHK